MEIEWLKILRINFKFNFEVRGKQEEMEEEIARLKQNIKQNAIDREKQALDYNQRAHATKTLLETKHKQELEDIQKTALEKARNELSEEAKVNDVKRQKLFEEFSEQTIELLKSRQEKKNFKERERSLILDVEVKDGQLKNARQKLTEVNLFHF